ncbi:hypothetical protein JCM3765_002209 [Sporobolomyces pararoseus]
MATSTENLPASNDPPRPAPHARLPYKTVNDHEVHLEVHLPSAEQISRSQSGGKGDSTKEGVPVLIWIHGGGWFDGAASDWSLPLLLPTLAQGWAFVSLDYRLVPQVTLADCVQDVKDGIEFIRSGRLDEALGGGVINGARLGVSGSSAGGALGIYASYTMSPPPSVVYALYAGSDLSFPSFYANVNFPSGRIEFDEISSHLSPNGPVVSNSPAQVDFSTLVAEGRTRACFWAVQEGKAIELSVPGLSSTNPEEDPALKPFIASKLVNQETPPTVLVHGTGDLMIPFEISKKLYKRLNEEGIDTVLLEEEGANHGFDLIPGVVSDKKKMQVFEKALEFVAKYL